MDQTYYVAVLDRNSNEPDDPNYERQLAHFEDRCATTTVQFPVAKKHWPEITHVGIYKDKVGGFPIDWGALYSPVRVHEKDILTFEKGHLTLSPPQEVPIEIRIPFKSP